jgi:hypothetical protein
MARREDKIWVARAIDDDYDEVYRLGKDRRVWNEYGMRRDKEEQTEIWVKLLEEFPHPN